MQRYVDIACLRIAAKATRAKRAVAMINAHPESVGAGTGSRVKVALAGLVLLPLLVTKAPAGIVLT